MAKALRDISPKKPKEGEFSGKRSSTKEKMDISNLNAAPGNQDFAKKHEIEKHNYPYDADAAFTSGKVKQVDMTKHGYKTPADQKVYENVEQVDEVLDSPLKKLSYARKASKQIMNADPVKMANDDKEFIKVAKRTRGMQMLNKKLTKESKSMKCESCGNMYEGDSCGCSGSMEDKKGRKLLLGGKKKLEEVLTKKTPAGKVISDFVHSDNPKFAGKSKKERMKMALGAYYGMHPEKSKKVQEDLAIPMLEGGKKKKEQKESAPGDTPIRFPSGNVGDTGRV